MQFLTLRPGGRFRSVLDLSVRWEEEVERYPRKGEPGIAYERSVEVSEIQSDEIHDTFLYYDENGFLRGIFRHYPKGIRCSPNKWEFEYWEYPGEFFIIVDPDGWRRGIGSALLEEATRRWGINFQRQKYTEEGRALIRAFLLRRRASSDCGSPNLCAGRRKRAR